MKTALLIAGAALVLAVSAPVFADDDVVGAANASPDEIIEVAPDYGIAEDVGNTAGSRSPRTFGTANQSVYTVRIQDFLPANNTVTYSTVNTGGIYVSQSSAPQSDWWAKVDVPNGSLIERIEMQACDTTATGQLLWGLARMDAPAATGGNVTAVGGTGAAATPGCAFFSLTPTATLQVDNRNKSYVLFVDWQGDFTAANKVAAVRVFYRLQVSPAPATATFPNDVPTTHPFFRYIEALATSGVTAGCGAGAYCPDSAVTRGQMAVFLSVALGLHFPN